jgi:hypothetical protein
MAKAAIIMVAISRIDTLKDSAARRESAVFEAGSTMSNNVNISDKVEAKIIRGERSWNFIYIALGFALSIEGTFVQMITSLAFPWNILLYLAVASATFWFFICSGDFQNRLLWMKQAYENRPR